MEPRAKPGFPFFAHSSLRTRIMLIFIVLITIPLTIQGYITYQDFSSFIKNKTAHYTLQIADQINKHLDTRLTEMQRLSLMPLYDQQVIGILKNHASAASEAMPNLRELEKMSSYIHGILFNRPEVKTIEIVSNNGVVFNNTDQAVSRLPPDYRAESWYVRTAAADGASVLLPQHQPHEGAGEKVVSVSRLLREPYSNQLLGMIKIDVSLYLFNDILSNLDMELYGKYIVTNRQNELFFENDAEPLYAEFAAIPNIRLDDAAAARSLLIGDEAYYAFTVVSRNSDLRVSSFVLKDEIMKESVALRNFTIGIGLLCLIAACVLALFFSYRISRPLMELKRKMFRVQMGHLNESVTADTRDEIGQLNYSFNRMVEEIHRLVNEVYVIGLREKEAELAALLSRINPHFIYNTLESINMLAVRAGNRDVSDMVTALGTLLRHSIDSYDRMLPLDKEMESIQSYVQIQRMRYGSRLNAVFDIEEPLGSVPVPKLLLQPLVENAIYHGIGDGSGTIWITVTAIGRQLLLIVRDDGAGLNEDKLRVLRESLLVPPSFAGTAEGGMALVNIAQRIRLLYGAQAELEIDASPGEGTAVTITLPLPEEENAIV